MTSRKFADELVSRLKKIYSIYERYMLRNDNSKLSIIMGDNTISLYLFNDTNSVDEIILNFDFRENKVYQYICINYMISLFGNMVIYNSGNVIYNNNCLPYLELVVLDNELLNKMKNIIARQGNEIVKINVDTMKDMNKEIPIKFYSQKVLTHFDDRISISKKLLSRC